MNPANWFSKDDKSVPDEFNLEEFDAVNGASEDSVDPESEFSEE